MTRAPHLCSWALAALLLVPTPSAAQEPSQDELARQHFASGQAYFATGEHEDAVREFRRAYEMSQRPELLFNIASSEERLGHVEAALEALEAYVAAGAPGMESERTSLDARIASLRQQRDARAEAAPAPVSPPPRSADPPYVAIAGFVIAGVGLAAFAVLGGLALAEDQSLWNTCGDHCRPEQVATLDGLALGADIGIGVAIAGGVMGILGLVLAPSVSSEPVALLPWGAPGGAGVILSGRL